MIRFGRNSWRTNIIVKPIIVIICLKRSLESYWNSWKIHLVIMRKIDFFLKYPEKTKRCLLGVGWGMDTAGDSPRDQTYRCNNLMHVCFYRNFRMAYGLCWFQSRIIWKRHQCPSKWYMEGTLYRHTFLSYLSRKMAKLMICEKGKMDFSRTIFGSNKLGTTYPALITCYK